jgi:uncharacterized membrane-anchored protein
MVSAVALGAAPDVVETPEQVFTSALRESIGAPAGADIGAEATVRLSEGLILVPREPAARLLTAWDKPVPPDFEGLLIGEGGVEAPGLLRFVPTGFVDSDAALAWTADDMLASLNDAVAQDNPERAKQNLEEREARRWVLPPHYDPETHQLTWAALIVPKSAPRESDGEITYHAVGFGRDGYVELTVVSSMQKADEVGHMAESFLGGLNFRQGKAYGDALPADPRVRNGLAGAMGVQSLHKALVGGSFWGSDRTVPVAGGVVASIGALSLLIYIRRHMRHEARRG